jgi:5-methylcytosine-specific restriction endonuclease McrA
MTATCEICAKDFTIKPSYGKNGRGRFCSQVCYGIYRQGWAPDHKPRKPSGTPLQRVPLVCQYCQKEFLCFPYQAKAGRKYCSKTCKYADKKRVLCTCFICEQSMHVTPSRLTFSDHTFCSPACLNTWRSAAQRGPAHPMWKGGISPFTYSREFHQKRPLILARDNYLCQVCGQRRNHMSVHHIDENPENHDENNLVTVCPTCHRGVIHGKGEVTFDSNRRAIFVADGSYCTSRYPEK